ncbi:MAG: ABC transporter permease [Flavobacterium sp.]
MQQVRRYSPQNNQKFSKLFIEIARGFVEGKDLAWRLFVRDVKASYRKSFLGFFWMFLPPLATAGVWIFLNQRQVVTIKETPMHYTAYVLCGTILWSLFAEAINKPIQRYQGAMGMMAKLNFPRESLILASFYDLIYSLCLKLLVLIPILWALGYPPGIHFFLVFPAIFMLLLVGISLGVFLSPLGLLYNDIGRALPIVLPFLMYFCPVIYPLQESGKSGMLRFLNPVTPFLENARSLMGNYAFELQTELAVWSAITVLFFLLGLLVLKIALPIIVERSGG